MISVMPGPALAFAPLDRYELVCCLEAMLRRSGTDARRLGLHPSLELACVRDVDITRLNTACMGCIGPTNILAFPSGVGGEAGAAEGVQLGSLALSVDTLRREAQLYGQEPAAYCRSLLAHGLAHLLGHEHGPHMDALCARMLDHTL